EAWKQHEGLFMSRFTHGAGASATDRWSSERNYREAVSAAAQRRSMVEGYLVSSVAIANKAEAWREQNTTSVVRHWLTKQYQLWLHVSSAAQDQQRVLTEELTEAALSATGQVDSVAALRISPTRKDSILASPRAEDSTREKSVIATSPEMVCLMRMLGPAPPPRSTTTEESRERCINRLNLVKPGSRLRKK
ncbi:Ankyrin Repeat, partial [Perkinsus olseni]